MFKLFDIKVNLSHREGYIRPDNCNGCGSGWNASVVPDTIYFLDISEVCCIHDDDYEYGTDLKDKERADINMQENAEIKVKAFGDKHWWYPTTLALKRVEKYYFFVDEFGESAFFDKEVKI